MIVFLMNFSDTLDTLQRDLASRYSLRSTRYEFGTRGFTITHVDDPDTLLDELIQRPDTDPDVLDERLPYWSEVWPTALALTPFILEGGLIAPNDTVIELGCGLGLPGIAAATRSENVIVTDYQQDALHLARINALTNLERDIPTALIDWRQPPELQKADILIAADIAYEERFFQPILNTFNQLLKPGGHIMLGEPNRPFAKPFFEQLEHAGWEFISYPVTVPNPNPIEITLYDIRRAD